MKKFISLVLACVLLLACLPMPAPVEAAQFTENTGVFRYYYDQLTSANSQKIYNRLAAMLTDGRLKTGTANVELLSNGLTDQGREALVVDFIAARDAFMLDHNVFYVDFDKLSLTYTQTSSGNQAIMGIGRENTYFRDGFHTGNVDKAVADFQAIVTKIANTASQEETLRDQIHSVYTQVMNLVSYALEEDATPENMPFVRNAYGALVRGQSVCEGYARAVKAVLDEMGIASVLVQGMFADENGELVEPHMWNYVRMDDYRWYLLDATMGDGHAPYGNGDLFFLKNNKDDVLTDYLPDGQISLSSDSKVFTYPELSAAQYVPLSNAFTLSGDSNVSYKGMNYAQAEEAGDYILCSFNGSQWYFYKNYIRYAFTSMGYPETTVYDYDAVGAFENIMGLSLFAATKVAPVQQPEGSVDLAYVLYSGTPEEMYDMSQVKEPTQLTDIPPYVVKQTPATSQLRGGQTYDVVLTFSKQLQRSNQAVEPSLVWINESDFLKENGAKVSDFTWDNDRTISFTLETANTYDARLTYFFKLEGLVGAKSTSAPRDFSFSVFNIPKFACPKIEGDINVAYANTPALIADNNLADNGWVGESGSEISKDLPNRLALVASTVSTEQEAEMLGKIEDTVMSAQTFELSLGLCGNQVAYVTGKPVKVFVPFPEGYNASSTGVTFKAYHFDSDGNPEEIDCVTTEKGIIMMCSAFSPFAVAAVEGTSDVKNVLISATGNGSSSDEDDFVSLEAGQSETVTFTANPGYVIDRIVLNGEELEGVSGQKTASVALSAEALESDNTLEASFVLEVMEPDSQSGYVTSLSTATMEPVVGASFAVNVDVQHEGQTQFAAAELRVSFDAEKLTFDAASSALNGVEYKLADGVIELADHGENQNLGNGVYQLCFVPKAAGQAKVLLEEAAFSDQASASSYDLTPSALTAAELTVQIQREQFSVTLPDIFVGPETVYNGDSYTFQVADPNYDYYNLHATIGGHPATVVDNGDGTYTVEHVTGSLVISGERSPKEFDVEFVGAEVDVESFVAIYKTDYTFTLPADVAPGLNPGTHYSLESITIGGVAYTGYSEYERTVTIYGDDITGDIVVTIKATQIDRNQVTVDVQGTGADFVKLESTTANVNAPYSVTVTPEAGWTYTISATMGGQDITLVEDGSDTYTVENVTDDLVFTVNRVLIKGGISVYQYVSIDGGTIWLVTNETLPDSGNVYTYDGANMFWSDVYQAYCYLVVAETFTADEAAEKMNIVQGQAVTVDYSGDVNMTGTQDANDAQLVYNIYTAMYSDFAAVSMEKFLRADVNHDRTVNTLDAASIISAVLNP